MKIISIGVNNFRSASSVEIPIKQTKDGYTYSLLGINESGKSSVLKGIALFENINPQYPDDYFDPDDIVGMHLTYELSDADMAPLRKILIEKHAFPKEVASKVIITEVRVEVYFQPEENAEREFYEDITFKSNVIQGFNSPDGQLVPIDKGDTETKPIKLDNFFRSHLSGYFWKFSHDVIFWESSDQYLITGDINLVNFASAPEETSIPLFNCFKLSGIEEKNIEKTIDRLTSPATIRNLESKLSRHVTSHIKDVWEDHKVEVKFEINNGSISLLVEDEGVLDKAKTTKQRSDGFRQFISFLLTLSTERVNHKMRPTIMLLDEPEVHLHPQAQINLMQELIKISSETAHIVIYATHSNYMIDGHNLSRNFIVTKQKNEKTVLKQIPASSSSYSEINFTVFNIATNDYHNELYGYLEDRKREELYALLKEKTWHNERSRKNEKVSWPKYIRNAIHHPENKSNRAVTYNQLVKSIKVMRNLKYTS